MPELAIAIQACPIGRQAGIHPHLINTTYPDAVNAVLGKLGLAPTVGVGNLNHLIPRIQFAVSQLLNVSPNNVEVYMVACHYHDVSISRQGTAKGAPYLMKVLVYGEDVTAKVGAERIFAKCQIPVPTDKERNLMVASSAVKMMTAIMHDTREIIHAPGPNGMIGGYPVQAGADGVQIALPSDWSPEEAVKINKAAMRFDGLEAIRDDGTVIFTKDIVNTFRQAFEFDCPELAISDWERRAQDLARRVFNR